ncbi:hypothetical protein M9Y10_018867 [Tritrichomonas musculus]|uniref:Uncharacterized protein n=1 Tax=Tritrichomonas musculus TaxID=1915356 RepID=A0ABR2HHZ9_9EUKA
MNKTSLASLDVKESIQDDATKPVPSSPKLRYVDQAKAVEPRKLDFHQESFSERPDPSFKKSRVKYSTGN